MKRLPSIVVALSISLFVYVFYRSEKTVVNELILLFFSLENFMTIRNSVAEAVPLKGIVIYSLPGGLWVFCATALSHGFYMQIINYRIRVICLPVLFAIGLELCQLVHLTNGIFDIWDVAFYVLFWLLAYCSFQSHRWEEHSWSPFTLDGFVCLACFVSVYLAHVNQ